VVVLRETADEIVAEGVRDGVTGGDGDTHGDGRKSGGAEVCEGREELCFWSQTNVEKRNRPRAFSSVSEWPAKTVASRAGAAAMGLKAVFLDFDDTLCATSEHDVLALEAATAAAASALSERGALAAGPVDRARLLADFRALFSRTPWDPSPDPVEVGAWRGALWARALALQVPSPEGGHVAAAVAAAGAAAQTAFDGHRLAHLVFAPGARAAVAHARARGLALVVITNGHHRVQRDKLAAVRAHELFPDPSAIIVGGEEVLRGGREKPSREIFLKACRVAGCAPNEAAHVGDSLATDVQVMRALLIGVALCFFFQPRAHAFRRSRDRSSRGVRRRAEPTRQKRARRD
jgi:N-acylneuraminate-9-phosphatase